MAAFLPPFEEIIISPRASDQTAHRRRRSPTTTVDYDVVDDSDLTSPKDQNRRKPRFSTSSLPDVDW